MRITFLSMIVLITTSAQIKLLTLGRSCLSNSPLVVTSFQVTPYPPPAGSEMNMTLTGVFSKSQYIYELEAKTSYNGQKYISVFSPINQTYPSGPFYSFPFNLKAGTLAGLYDVQLLLDSKKGNSISCWDFTYHIT